MKFTAFAALAAATSFSAPALAAVELDVNAKVMLTEGRDYLYTQSTQAGANGYDLAQTFIATKTGGLSSIALQAFVAGPPTVFTLTVYSGNVATGGMSTLLGSATFSAQDEASFLAGGMTSIDLSGLGLSVTAGTLYSYEVSAPHPTVVTAPQLNGRLYYAIGSFAGTDDDGFYIDEQLNDYAGGRSYRETYTLGMSNDWNVTGNFATDRGFQTFVDVAPVPEPGEWAMMIAGLGIVGAAARRRRTARA